MTTERDLPPAPRWVSAASRVIRSLPAGRYRAMNWVPRRSGRPFWAALPDDLGGLLFRCDLADPLMREPCLTGRYEPQETALLMALVGPGAVVVDVGANWGYFTLASAHLAGSTGRIVSIEADPNAVRTLESNVAKNGLTQVRVVAAAASDADETITVRRYGSNQQESSNFGVVLEGAQEGGGASLKIPARPLDAMLDAAGIEHVDVLKMDIEGAEARALAGVGRRLAAGAIDWILLELHPAYLRNQGGSAADVVAQLESHGFDTWQIDHSPSAHRRAASTDIGAGSLLKPLSAAVDLGDWPHVLLGRRGVDRRVAGIGRL